MGRLRTETEYPGLSILSWCTIIMSLVKLWKKHKKYSDNQGQFIERDSLKSTRDCGLSIQNVIVHQLSQILFYIRRKVLNYVTVQTWNVIRFYSLVTMSYDGQDQWAEKPLFFIQWSAHDDHMHNPSAFIMMILNGMVGQNLKPGYCVVILIMKEWRIQCQKVVVETFKSHLLNEADYI